MRTTLKPPIYPSDERLKSNMYAVGAPVVEPIKVIPIKPHPKQQLFLELDDVKEALFGGGTGGGKLLSLDTPIPTPMGWVRNGDLRDGDEIFDEGGRVCNVLWAHAPQTPQRAFRLTFDDGSEIEAGAEHLWLTFNARERVALTRRSDEFRAERRRTRPSRVTGHKSAAFTASLTLRNRTVLRPAVQEKPKGTIRSTLEIFETLTINGRVNHAIPVAKALELPEVDLPIDPYCLGAWLGDGSSSGGGFTGIDAEIWQAFERCGYEVKHRSYDVKAHHVRGISKQLRSLGVLKNKHIPPLYLRASREQRLALLQGLMDTDGHACASGAAEFTSVREQLVWDVYDLIVGLGWKCAVQVGRATLKGRDCGPKYRIKWTPSEYVFRLARKRERQRLATRMTTRFRYIENCVEIEPVPMRCLTVDSPSHLYLAGRSYIPTHNTAALLADALKYVHVKDYSALLLRVSYPDLKQEGGLIDLAHKWLQPHRKSGDAHWSEQDHTWTFQSGATLRFGYLATENDKYRYQGGEYQYIGFDEVTQFRESQYRYLFSRLRKKEGLNVPLRIRGATNPGGVGGQWVYDRFIPEDFRPEMARELKVWWKELEDGRKTAFVPSLLADNPSLDQESYLHSLAELDEVTRQQYLTGDWLIQVRGDILYTYSEIHTVISWSQFAAVFGEPRIPKHWRLSVYQDFGTTPDHPCVTSWFATAGQNAPVVNDVGLADRVFLYRGMMLTQCTAAEVAEQIRHPMLGRGEISRCERWQMSHEASSERLEYQRQGLPFRNWKTGKTRGIEQLKNALALQDTDKPHPFKPALMGCPRLLLIVDDDELVYPKTDAGLARWRAEIPAYHTNVLKSGDVMTRWEPYPLFNDAIDTMRAAAADYFPKAEPVTFEEKVDRLISEPTKTALATAKTSGDKLSAALAYEFEKDAALVALRPPDYDEWTEEGWE